MLKRKVFFRKGKKGENSTERKNLQTSLYEKTLKYICDKDI